MIQSMAGIKLLHVPYKGTGQSVVDAIAGRIQMVIGSTTALTPHVKSGKIKSLGVTAPQRLTSLPDQPTLAEMGLPGFDYTSWFGIVGPAGIPPAIVNALNAEVGRVVGTPEVVQLFLRDGTDTFSSTPEQFREMANGGLDKVEKILKATGIKLD
jgi:tripartite-type tricarboxylate transporter receptor subunit TctC